MKPASTVEGAGSDRDLVASLAGNRAGMDRAVAHRTRRVVLASLGVMQEQKAGRKRSRSLALASILLFVLVLGPFAWHIADNLIGGERLNDIAMQFSLWVCIFLGALLAAALVAGWARNRS